MSHRGMEIVFFLKNPMTAFHTNAFLEGGIANTGRTRLSIYLLPVWISLGHGIYHPQQDHTHLVFVIGLFSVAPQGNLKFLI